MRRGMTKKHALRGDLSIEGALMRGTLDTCAAYMYGGDTELTTLHARLYNYIIAKH